MKLTIESALSVEGDVVNNVLGFVFNDMFIHNPLESENGFEVFTKEESCEYYKITLEQIEMILVHNDKLPLM